MTMPWCRLHADFATDPKMQSMDETFQRRFIMLLCLQCTGDLMQLSDDEVACALRITPDELQQTKDLFSKKGFINGDWGLKNWDKRQYKSDTSTERVQKHREKKRSGNVSVTPPDTDTDTDKKNIQKRPFSFLIKTLIPEKIFLTEDMIHYTKCKRWTIKPEIGFEAFVSHHRAKGTKFQDWHSAFQKWVQNDIKWHPENQECDTEIV
jgi:hypothetical protein